MNDVVGITGFNAYVPYSRLREEEVASEWTKAGKGREKAVAYYDEDSATMAVAAAMQCVSEKEAKELDDIFFASTTAPYLEKQASATIAGAIDAREDVRLADFSNSLRACSSALLSALDAAKNGDRVLVAAGDCRLGAADGTNEITLGDGAAAFTVGSEKVLAKVIGSFSIGKDIPDIWRANDDLFPREWDVRYAQMLSYEPMVKAAVSGLCEKTGLSAKNFSKAAIYAHEQRYAAGIAAKLGFEPQQVQDGMYAKFGNTGCAAAPLTLIAALEEAKPGDKLLFVSYGEGCDAIAFEVTDEIANYKPSRTTKQYLEIKNNKLTYAKYLKWKSMLSIEPQRRPDQERASLTDYTRNYKKNLSMYGTRCKCCGTPQYPPQRICAKCHTWDEMEPWCFARRKGTLKTFTQDGLSISKDSPNNLVVAEFEGGGKLMTFMVDVQADELEVGMPVVPTFRSMFKANGFQTYAWKVMPDCNGGEQ